MKYLNYSLFGALFIAINVLVMRYMLDDQVDNLSIPKLAVLDMQQLMEDLSETNQTPQEMLADSQNLLKLLEINGYIIIDKMSTLGNVDKYVIPKINPAMVRKKLTEAGQIVLTAADLEQKYKETADKVRQDFTLPP